MVLEESLLNSYLAQVVVKLLLEILKYILLIALELFAYLAQEIVRVVILFLMSLSPVAAGAEEEQIAAAEDPEAEGLENLNLLLILTLPLH